MAGKQPAFLGPAFGKQGAYPNGMPPMSGNVPAAFGGKAPFPTGMGVPPGMGVPQGLGQPTAKPAPMVSAGLSFGGKSAPVTQPKAFAGKAAPTAAALEKELGDLSKWLKHKRGDFGSFQVILDQVVIRSMPSVKSRPQGRLKKGDMVEGEIRGEWLLVTSPEKGEPEGLDTGAGEWLLIDGTGLVDGVGVVAKRVLVDPEIRREFGTALEIGLPPGNHANQVLEVKPSQGEVTTVNCPSGKVMLVHDLPTDCDVKVRFFLKDPGGGALAVSNWVKAHTVDVKPFEEGDEYELDLVGNPRGGCPQSNCPAYVPDNEGVGQNYQLSDARCLRCGCNVAMHALIKPDEPKPKVWTNAKDGKEGKDAKAAKPKPPPEPLLIDKAIALPKETMLARWRALDVPSDQKSWPKLKRQYRELVAWSDLHADMGQNMEHLERLAEQPDTVLILAGDLATNLEIMESSFRLLKEKFGEIFYVPGNHELWVNKKEGMSSIHKFLAILELCEKLEVHTRPAFISDDCAVCPLFSWYKDNLVDGFTRDKANIAFDIQTQWPWDITGRGDTNDAQQPEIADFFAALNEPRLESAPKEAIEALRKAQLAATAYDEEPENQKDIGEDDSPGRLTVVTLSHFVPRQECYPGPRRLCGVMGCREIEDQLRSCGASCHIFGHSHIAIDREVEAVRYVQHPLGYPTDPHRKSKPMRVWAETTAAKGRDPAIAHQIALAEDGKWLVWNTVWGAANADLADVTKGAASEQYRSRSKEDMERAGKHFKALKDTGALELQSVQRLRDQARHAGRSAASSVQLGEALDSETIEPIRPPTELETSLWDSMLEAVKLAGQAVCEQSLDSWLLRKGDEWWEAGPENYHLLAHHEPGKQLQADFEKQWSDHVAPDPVKVAEASAAEAGSKRKPKDPAKMREIALGGDAKWLVWNTVWYATNRGLAKHHSGPARDQYNEKANEDLERREEHVAKIRKTGALSEAVLMRLQDQAENAGQAAADHAKVGKELPALEVKAMDAPPDVESKQWGHMVRSVRFAAQATNESSLDAYSFRKGNERWEMNRENYHLCQHFHKAGIIQKRFESWWHNHVAPDPGENWEGAVGIPEATITKDIIKEMQEQIKGCNEKVMERPPGRWQDKQMMWEDGNIMSREKERELRAAMAGEQAEEEEEDLWHPPPQRDLELKITHLEDPSQSVTITISNEMLVKQLKEAIVDKVGRGKASDMSLSTSGENKLIDDIMLSTVEEEVERGVLLFGIDISEGREVNVTITHATSDTPQSMVVTVMDNSTVLDVRRAIKAQLQERALSSCKLVKQMGNAFSSLKDDEKLNGRTELLFLGRDLPAPAAAEAPKAPEKKAAAGKAAEPAKAPVAQDAAPPPAPAPDVNVTVTHAMAGCSMQLTLSGDCSCGDVRKAVMATLGETRLSQVKLVRRQGGENGMIMSLADADPLNGRTSLLCMGREWDEAALAPAAAEAAPAEAAPAEAAPVAPAPPPVPVEMTVSVVIDRDMDLRTELSAMSGTPVLRLKEQIAADDPTGSTSVEQFGLRLPGLSDPLPDDFLLLPEMTELELAVLL